KAREIHLRVACPPIIAPCFYGIDMSRREELIAPPFADRADGTLSPAAQNRLAQELGVDSLRDLPIEALARSIDLPAESLCRACVTGQYPTRTGQYLFSQDSLIASAAGVAAQSNRPYEGA